MFVPKYILYISYVHELFDRQVDHNKNTDFIDQVLYQVIILKHLYLIIDCTFETCRFYSLDNIIN